MLNRAAVVILLALPASADEAPRLGWPVDCTLGETCFIQQYTDRDPGPDATDFTCGPLAYDGHKGTDIALPSLADREAGVEIRAAAAGTVEAVRDDMPDIPRGAPGAPDIAGRECGNGVVITHGDGWETQYCHMEEGSIAVAPGDRVSEGAALGRIGVSGDTQFPHLHLSVRHDGAVIDPFAPQSRACGESPGETLWRETPDYRPGGVIAVGFSDRVPEYESIKAGDADLPLETGAEAIVLWAYFFGGREGDVVRITIEGPEGTLVDHEETLDKSQAQLFRAAGRRTPPGGWPEGRYRAEVELIRDGKVVDSLRKDAKLGV